MGFDLPKQYAKLGAYTVLEHSIQKLLAVDRIEKVFVGVSADDAYYQMIPSNVRVEFYEGGVERSDTVNLGLKLLAPEDWVVVHDAARPFVDANDITKLLESCLEQNRSGLLATKVTETVKQKRTTLRTLNRDEIWLAQTPQVANVQRLRDALHFASKNKLQVTDEASALELLGDSPMLQPANRANLKLTDHYDWMLGQLIAKQQGLV